MAGTRAFRCVLTRCCLVVFFAGALCQPAAGEAAFPAVLELTDGGRTHRMILTGQTARMFLFFRVYDLAHYAEAAVHETGLSPATVVMDGPAKAIAITFARTLGRERIRDELRSSIGRNAQPGWLEQAGGTLQRFLAAIDRDAQAGDSLVYYWLPGGRLYAEFNGERFFAAEDVVFAKLIWSIWFGDDPACDPGELLALATAEEVGP